MNYLFRRLEEIDGEEALIVRYLCNDKGTIDLDKSYRLLVRSLLQIKEVRAKLLANIVALEQEKEAKQ